jgi:selenocysteine lyase/cysteine desulfurase
VPGVTVYGDFSLAHAAIVALNIGDRDSGEVSDILSERYGIAVRSGAHCAPRMHEALGTKDQGAVRFSFSWFTTEQEIDTAIQAVQEIAREAE